MKNLTMVYLTVTVLAVGLVLVGVQRNYSQKMSVSTGTNTQAEGQDVVPVASRVKAQISKFFTGGISGLGSDDITLGSRLEAVQSNRLENVDAEGGSNGMSDGQTGIPSNGEKVSEPEEKKTFFKGFLDKFLNMVVRVMTNMDLSDPSTLIKAELPVMTSPSNDLTTLASRSGFISRDNFLNRQTSSQPGSSDGGNTDTSDGFGQVYSDHYSDLNQGDDNTSSQPTSAGQDIVDNSFQEIVLLQNEAKDKNVEEVVYTAKATKPITSMPKLENSRTSDDVDGKTGFSESLVKLGSKPKVAIMHTHNSEAYKASQGADYVWGKNTGVVGVGTVLADELYNTYGISTVHSTRIHDYPDWNKSYVNSLDTMERLVDQYSSLETLIDLHRDSVDSPSLNVATINGVKVARVMIVVTDDTCGLYHPNWNKNYQFALKLNEQLNKMYPGLSRGVSLKTNSRLNQHVHDQAIIIEVGGTGNTRDEADRSARMIAKALAAILD